MTVYVKHPHGCGWSNGSLLSGVNKPNMLRGHSPLAPPQVQSVGLVVKRGDIRLICTNSSVLNMPPDLRSVIYRSTEVRYDLPDFRRRMLAAERRSGN